MPLFSNSVSDCNAKPSVTSFFDALSNTFTYLVRDPGSQACAIIDPVLGFDYASASTDFQQAQTLIKHIKDNKLELQWLIETHVHADHISAAPYLQNKLGGKLAISEQICCVQNTFGKIYNEGSAFERDGSQFDRLFKDNDSYQIGGLTGLAMATPGHTPACMTHVIGDAVFVGDTLFMPDAGTARADFPGGNAEQLYHSTQRILELDDSTRVFICHDYGPNGRDITCETTIAAQRSSNIHVNRNTTCAAFVALREARDYTLAMPRLMLPSLQVNMRAGYMPNAESNDMIYLKIPLNAFSK